ncbi:MAG: hypothetical protein ACR2FN_10725 [Chitinophagaceae bacterium]
MAKNKNFSSDVIVRNSKSGLFTEKRYTKSTDGKVVVSKKALKKLSPLLTKLRNYDRE